MPRKKTGLASSTKKRYIKSTCHCLILCQNIVGGLYTIISEGKFTQSKKLLSVYCPNLELYHIKCRPVPLDDPKAIQYIHLCQLAHELTRTNIKNASPRAMRSDGTALLMLADLIQYFSEYAPPETASGHGNRTIRELISYVNEHYTEKLSLEDAADYVGFSREYFCRFFKQHMGLTFLRYLNEVRISHAGRLLSSTDLSISEIMNTCGFTNQTIFNRLFKEIYGMTPRQARKTLSVS